MRKSAFLLLAAAACVEQAQTIEVSDPNDLGITALTLERSDDHASVTLRALARSEEVASVRLTTGTIADLSQILPGNDTGSELVLVAGDTRMRTVTHETRGFSITPDSYPGLAPLLTIPTVARTLAREANITVVAAAPVEQPYYVNACPAAYLLTTPVATQCCWSRSPATNPANRTIFVRTSDNYVIIRAASTTNPVGCKASDGVSSCNGADCYFGPLGFARAQATYGGLNPKIRVGSGGDPLFANCHAVEDTLPPTYGNVTGTNPTGLGCPGGASGDGEWDY